MKKKSIKGQVLPFVAIVVLVLAMFVVVLVNIAQLEYSRQKAQIAADAGASTFMRSRAGFYNSAGLGNMAYSPMGLGIAPGFFFHNKISLFGANLTPYGTVVAPKSIDGLQTWIRERLQIIGGGISGLVMAANGAPYANCYAAIRQNGCKVGPLSILGSMGATSHGLKTQDITLFSCNIKIIYIYGVPVPIPLPPYSKEKVGSYVCRTWTLGTRNAQPPKHIITIEATKDNSLWFGSLVGLPSPPAARATASAQLYLDVTQGSKVLGFKHNGGFPRLETDEGAAGYLIEPIPAYPKFNAVIVPVKVAGVSLLH